MIKRLLSLGKQWLLLTGAVGWSSHALGQAAPPCSGTYTSTGVSAGSTSGLFAEFYPGLFQSQAGFAAGSPVTFFTATAAGQTRTDGTLNFQNTSTGTTGSGYLPFGVTVPPASGTTAIPTQFSARHRGSLYLKAGAAYTLTLRADDAAYVFLGKEATLSQPTPNNAFLQITGTRTATAAVSRTFTAAVTGLYDVQVLFEQSTGGSELRLSYSGGPDNLSARVIPQTEFCAGPSGRDYATSNLAPSTAGVTNAVVYNNGTRAALAPGIVATTGFDPDGTIASYTITSLPAQGQLQYNVNASGAANYQPVTAPFTVLVADLGRLAYLAPNGTGIGTQTFQFNANDNSGAAGNTATYSIPVQDATADLSASLTSPATAPQGSLVYFTATARNNGPAAPGNIVLTIQLPANLTGVSLSNSGTYDAASGVATFPAFGLGSGASTTRSIAFTMLGQPVTGTASVSAANFPDSNSGDNQASSYTAPTQVADVAVALNGPTRVITNQTITYTAVTTNLGPSTATSVAPRVQLPASLTGVVVSDGGVYNASSGQVSWPTVGTLAVGQFLAYTVRFNAPATTGTTITASASASSATANGDPAAGNNDGTNGQAQITTDVISTAAAATECVDVESPAPTFQAVPNSYYPGVGTVAEGSTTLTLGPILSSGSQTPIGPGDLVVIMQMQAAELNTTNTDGYGDGIAGNNLAAGNLQNANFRAGLYEYGVVASVSGSTITLRNGLINAYISADATASQGQQRFQVIRVPRNFNLTLTGDVTGPRWNGRTGGVVVLDVNGTLNMNGRTIDMAGKGFRGGAGQQLTGATGVTDSDYRHSNTLTTSANKGEGTAGTPRYLNDADQFAAYRAGTATTPFLDTQVSGLLPASVTDGYPLGDRARGGPGNAGGGGTDGNPGSNDQNTGGGGGGNAGRGGQGGNAWNSNDPYGGYGGADFTQATPSRVIMGGGGGAGTTNNGTVQRATGTGSTPTNPVVPENAGIPGPNTTNASGVNISGFASSGAAGGGIVLLRAGNLTGTGIINVNGAAMPYVAQNDGSGGGGAGGSAVVLVNASNGNPNSPVLDNLTVLANGGQGGRNTGGGSPHGPGGGGAGGAIFASSRLNAATASNASANGTTFGFESYGSGVGGADQGQAQTGITRADVPNQIAGCPADVVTTLTSSATTAAPGTAITFTLNLVNNGPGTALNLVPTITVAPNLPAGSFSSLGGGTYNPSTGVVTFPATASFANSGTLSYAVTFTMPAQTVTGKGISTADGDNDPRTANNDGTLPAANVRVEPVFDIAGRIFDDVNYGGGAGRNYAAAEASALASGVSADGDGSATGSAGAKVELYNTAGTLVATTTSGADGLYGFSGIVSSSGTSYTVRVVNNTVRSARAPQATGVVPVQTFRTQTGTDDLNRVGGEAPQLLDAATNSGSQTLAALTDGQATPQSVSTVTFGSTSQVTGVDFGFNFSTITSTRSTGQGSLRQFMLNANALPNLLLDQAANAGSDPAAGIETSIFMISDGQAHAGLRSGLVNQLTTLTGGQQVASIAVNTATDGALPALTDERTVLDGATQTRNVGNANGTTLGTGGTVGGSVSAATALGQVSGPEVQIVGAPGTANSTYGLTLSAPNLTVTNLGVYGFGNSAGNLTGADVYVTGNALTGTVLTGNVLGTATNGFQDPGSSTRSLGSGIYLGNFNTNTVGAIAATITNNLIGFHGGSGIESAASGSPTTLLIENNEIRGNGLSNTAADGIHLGNYGGTVRGNLLAANQGTGLDLSGSTGSATISGNTVTGNGVGGTATAGIRLDGAANVISRNVLSGNTGAGVLGMSTTTLNTISQNSTFGNGTLGIDLLNSADNQQAGTSAYVTRNDNADADAGGNGLLNFPVTTQAVSTGGNLVLTGYAPTGALLEFFVSDANGPAFGQGRTYLFSRTEGTGGNDTNTDRDAARGNYSALMNGLDQGAESNVSRFLFRVAVNTLPTDVQTALTNGTLRLTATTTVTTGSNRTTSEFSGNILVRPNTPLPVTLTDFAAQARQQDALLTWQTAQEVNNAYFAVERSLDGSSFQEIGQRPGAGTSTQPRSYTFTDAGAARLALGGMLYYRLRQVDVDGTETFSTVQPVRFGPAAAVSVYPVPTTGSATLDLRSLPAARYQVQVFDALGRKVFDAATPGATELPLPSQHWATGVYQLRVTGGASTHTLRLTRQ
ncbi:T9SS type A sorting domain-containing protein [Hymenobacter metallilatus]|uniref:T9SS C-terminal target domain-containing protein n=1 Tax=Hymenobacter metallilatus TaxID=2493666 RepID=A0A3R9NLB4_9BACT|nr:T9SS type A sorting domain-containing protein [Hymenobacter metallilatus]RSK36161.1 T9SS C-terminal target domain-containing protein [Hymenobacter metallilatus]